MTSESVTYDFIVYFDTPELSDDQINRLFEAGCGDGLPGSSRGESMVCFSREAESLEFAIRSAVDDVSRAGLRPTRVELPDESLQDLCHTAGGRGS
jgi:hypothetical protein